ncbi:MAG TPA: DnaJ domain-containing protein [Verrucomicrobiae bacterium]|jgi:DnaJ-class molecular chaperone
MSDDYYSTLGIPSSASADEIKARFRVLSHAYHPDKFSTEKHKKDAEEEFKRINSAYQILSDPTERARYDALRSQPSERPGNSQSSSRRPENERRYSKPEPSSRPKGNNEPAGEPHLDIWAGIGGLIGLVIVYVFMYFLGTLSK